MTVEELIGALKTYPPHWRVVAEGSAGTYDIQVEQDNNIDSSGSGKGDDLPGVIIFPADR